VYHSTFDDLESRHVDLVVRVSDIETDQYNLDNKIDKIEKQWEIIMESIKIIMEKITELQYAPGGPKFQEAKESWTSKVKGEWKPIEHEQIVDGCECEECKILKFVNST
jgi:hypothetical protein